MQDIEVRIFNKIFKALKKEKAFNTKQINKLQKKNFSGEKYSIDDVQNIYKRKQIGDIQ